MIMRPMRPLCFAAIAWMAALPALAQPVAQRDIDRLSSDDTEQVQQARSSIISVINDSSMAVGDRLQASQQLVDPVRAMIESGDEIKTVNGLMIAGCIVTPEAIGLIEQSYKSDEPGVRYAAMRALRTSMRILGQQRTASLQSAEIMRQVKAAGEMLRSDADPYVAEGAARALVQTAKLTDSRLTAAADAAFVELAKGTSARLAGIGSLSEEKQEGVVRIAMMSTFELGRILQSSPRKPGTDAIRDAAGLGGDALAYVYKKFQDAGRQIGSINASETKMLALLIGSSENLIYYAQSAMSQPGEQTQLRANFESGNDRDFNRNILGVIGGTGTLTRPPFSLKADRFIASGG